MRLPLVAAALLLTTLLPVQVQATHTVTLSGISPTTGNREGGNTFTITGNGFDPGASTTVLFGSVAATGVSVNSASSITGTVPANAAAVAVTVRVTNGDSQSGTTTYTYQNVAISSVVPKNVPIATMSTFTVTGSAFCLTCNPGSAGATMWVEVQDAAGAWVAQGGVNVVSNTQLTLTYTATSTACVGLRVRQSTGNTATVTNAICGQQYPGTAPAGFTGSGFEHLAIGQPPTFGPGLPVSTSGTGGITLANIGASGSKSLYMSSTNALQVRAPSTGCGADVTLLFPTNLPGNAGFAISGSGPGGSAVSGSWNIQFGAATGFTMGAGGPGGGSSSAVGGGVQPPFVGEWTRYTITCYVAPSDPAGGWVEVYDWNRGKSFRVAIGAANLQIDTITLGFAVAGDAYVDNWYWQIPTPTGSALTHTVTVPIPDLVGMDVDRTGSIIVTRSGNPNVIKTWTAATLAPGGTDSENYCNRIGGVAALPNHVSYLRCDPGDASDVTAIFVRSGALGEPTRPPVCTDTGFCITNIEDSELEGDMDAKVDIVTLEQYPFDYSRWVDGFLDGDSVFMTWGVGTMDGKAGVVTYVMRNNQDDDSMEVLVPINPTGNGPPTDMCSIQDANGNGYFYATHAAAKVSGYRIDFQESRGDVVFTNSGLEVTLEQTFPGTQTTAGAVGVACGEGRFAVLQNDRLTLWNRDADGKSTLPYHTITGLTNVPERGVAMSRDGKWVAYVSGGKWHVIAAQDVTRHDAASVVKQGTEVAANAMPAGDFRRIFLHGLGSNLWVGTSTGITAYGNLWTLTTGADVVDNGPTPTQPPGPDPNAPPTGVLGPDLALNPLETMIFSLVTMLGGAVVGWYLTGGRAQKTDGTWNINNGNNVVVACGAYAGMIISVMAWGFPFWIPLAIGVVAIGLIVSRFATNWGG